MPFHAIDRDEVVDGHLGGELRTGEGRLRDGQPEVQRDVDDDPSCAERVGVEVASAVGGAGEEVELIREALGVERPPLHVAGGGTEDALERVEALAEPGRDPSWRWLTGTDSR